MNKTTTTLLTAAGLLLLAGCKTEVMKHRRYQGDPPQNDPAMKQSAPAAQRPMEQKFEQGPAPAPAPDAPLSSPSSRFSPMSGSYSNEGVEDDNLRLAPRRKGAKRAAAVSAGSGASVYIVKPGDTLGRIARRHGVSVDSLRQANNRTAAQDRFLRPGTKLNIPGAKAGSAPKAVKGKNAPRRGKKTPALNADGTYTMVRGDNIPKVARKFGIRAKALQAANNLTDEETTKLQIGHKLIIPAGKDAKVVRKGKAAPKKAAARKPAPAPKKEAAEQSAPLPPPPADNGGADALPPPAPAPVSAAAADTGTAALPPPAPAPVENGAASNTSFVSVAGYKTLEEFAAKNNTTVDEVIKLNPRIDRNAPISTYEMLYVPVK